MRKLYKAVFPLIPVSYQTKNYESIYIHRCFKCYIFIYMMFVFYTSDAVFVSSRVRISSFQDALACNRGTCSLWWEPYYKYMLIKAMYMFCFMVYVYMSCVIWKSYLHVIYICCMYMLYEYVIWICYMYMLYEYVLCICYMYMLYVYVLCICYVYMF